MRSDKRSPLTSNLCPIINTLEHLVLVLGNWAETPFFLQLQSQKSGPLSVAAEQPSAFSRENSASEHGESSSSSTSDIEAVAKRGGIRPAADESMEPDMEQTVFEKSIVELNYLRDNLLLEVVDSIFYTVSARSLAYRSEVSFVFVFPQTEDIFFYIACCL